MSSPLLPLCVDLDGTLLQSDLLLESLVLLLKGNPLYLFCLPVWLLRGKAVLKAEIARRVELNAATLPYRGDLLDWLRSEKDSGRRLWLCTASNEKLARAVADHLGIFDKILASDDSINLDGTRKAQRIVDALGWRGFDYCGNHWVDVAIWERSRGAVVVDGTASLDAKAGSVSELLKTFPSRRGLARPLIRALRPHQWVKNLLVFVPLAAAHRVGDAESWLAGIAAFAAFCMCASSVYLLNDLLDLEADRTHSRKRHRPFAAGHLSIAVGLAIAPILLLGAIVIAAWLPQKFLLVLLAYYALTVAYSFGLKRVVMIDTISLAGLYTVRVVAGAAAVAVPLSFWLLLFAVFLFLSLALVKRYAELDSMQRQGKLEATGRGYHVADLPVLLSLGTGAGYLSVLVLALYINTPAVEALYRHPKLIWLLCILMLYWISRVWMVAHRGAMHDDPLVFALKDRVSLGVGVLAAITVALAA